MSFDPLAKTIKKITEESLDPVQVPLIVGSEEFIVTQQDVRIVEDTRLLKFNRISNNGIQTPVEATVVDQLFGLLSIINAKEASINGDLSCGREQAAQPMEISPSASHSVLYNSNYQQPFQWNKYTSTEASAFPFSYSRSTSTSELCIPPRFQEKQVQTPCFQEKQIQTTGFQEKQIQTTSFQEKQIQTTPMP